MPFVAEHLRLTNSGKIPELFLTAKVQSPSDLSDAKLGKLFFVVQIDLPWSQASTIGSSLINMIGREYYRQEGHSPLESFEKSIGKANRLLSQLAKEYAPDHYPTIDALIALAVGDEIHIAYAGVAEAYFLREDKIGLITDPGRASTDPDQVFGNLVSGEIASGDVILLGSPGLYSAITSDELAVLLKHPLAEAGKMIGRRLHQMKQTRANAIIIDFQHLHERENEPLQRRDETIYLDQPIDSTLNMVSFQAEKLITPVGKLLKSLWQKQLKPHTERLAKSTALRGKQSAKALQRQVNEKIWPQLRNIQLPELDRLTKPLAKIVGKESTPKPGSFKDPDLPVGVNHYGYTKSTKGLKRIFNELGKLTVKLSKALTKSIKQVVGRSPRTWYIVVALILLASIGASIQLRKKQPAVNPIIPTASLDEAKQLYASVKQDKAYGNLDKARAELLATITKAQEAKKSTKLAVEAGSLIGNAQRDLDQLASVTRLTLDKPLTKLTDKPTTGTVFEGIFYFPIGNLLKSAQLTGGPSVNLAQLPDSITSLYLEPNSRLVYMQAKDSQFYQYNIATKKLIALTVSGTADTPSPTASSLASSTPTPASLSTTAPAATIAFYSDTLYALYPADNSISKQTIDKNKLSAPTSYLKKKVDISLAIDMSIDGSVFVLAKDGITKFSRGAKADFTLTNLPKPFDVISSPVSFKAVEDGTSYYLTDKGNETIQPRIIEFDKSGKFIHQYFLPANWQKSIQAIVTNPKTHKAWVLVDSELYEFTLVQ